MKYTQDNMHKNLMIFIFEIFVYCILSVMFCSAASAADATLYISPITGTYTIDTMIPLRVMVSSAGDLVNAVEGKLTYDPNELEVIDAVKDGSVLTSWTISPVYDNNEGTLSFGGLLSTSTVLDRGLVVAFTVRAKRSGDVRVHFATGAAVHAADGTGGNLLSTLNGGIYAITPKEGVLASTSGSILEEENLEISLDEHLTTSSDTVSGEVLGAATGTLITSVTHPDQTLWYALATSTINWGMPDGIARVRLALDKKPRGEGIVSYEAPKQEKILTNLDDGIWYVHLTREFIDGHTDTNAYQLNIDTTPPADMTVSEKTRESGTDPNVIFLVSATDTASGIDHYVFTLDDGTQVSWADDGGHEYHAPPLKAGTHTLIISAVDRAGNKSDEARVQFSVEYLATPALAVDVKQFTEGDHLVLSLNSVPNAIVSLQIQGGETANEEFTVDANGRGQFTSKLILSPGAYDVWGVARNAQGALSRESERMHIEVRPSVVGIVKRHPLIPVAVVVFFIFLVLMRAVLKRLRSGEGSFGAADDTEEEDGDNEERVLLSPPLSRPVISGAVVLGVFKEKPKDRSGKITITR